MDSIIWAIKHTMRDIADMGLSCALIMDASFSFFFSLTDLFSRLVCTEVVDNFSSQAPEISNGFYQQYYLSILQDIFWVVTDADHKSGAYTYASITHMGADSFQGFRLQSHLLARMFELVETGQIQLPLFDPATVSDPNISNSEFLREYCVKLLQSAFSHLQL